MLVLLYQHNYAVKYAKYRGIVSVQLRLELAKLKSPQRIQSIASNQLGMIVPPSVYCAAKTESTSQTFSKGPEQGLVNQVANAFRPAKAEAHKSN